MRQRGGVEPGDPRQVDGVDVLGQVSVGHPVLGAHVLVLAVVVLLDLAEAHGGIARLVERGVVSTAEEPIATKHHECLDGQGVQLTDLVHIAGELAAGAVVGGGE